MLKIVLDTNLLIDASSDFYHFANRIIDLVIGGQVEAFANRQTLRENKFLAGLKIDDEGFQKKLEYFYKAVKLVEGMDDLDAVEDDAEDNKILASAVACRADFLITSDRHLLKLEKFRGTRIVRPDYFWQIWEEEGDGGWMRWLESFIR